MVQHSSLWWNSLCCLGVFCYICVLYSYSLCVLTMIVFDPIHIISGSCSMRAFYPGTTDLAFSLFILHSFVYYFISNCKQDPIYYQSARNKTNKKNLAVLQALVNVVCSRSIHCKTTFPHESFEVLKDYNNTVSAALNSY